MPSKRTVQLLLFMLSVVVFLDRISISLAAHRIQEELSIVPERWGWILGAFTLGYAAFGIPSGAMGDRIGARKMLTYIVLWWSVFTTLTGLARGFYFLLACRLLFGIGEAGAYPNGAIVISQWFPESERGRAHGMMFLGAQIGGMLVPLVMIPLQMRFGYLGWRLSFAILGCLGVFWVLAWRVRFRDFPAATIQKQKPPSAQLNWKAALSTPGVWFLAAMYLLYCYAGFFYISWFPIYLLHARGFQERDLLFTVFPPAAGAVAYVTGGYLNDFLRQRIGLRWGPRLIGAFGFGVATVCLLAMTYTRSRSMMIVCFTIAAGGLSLLVPSAWAVCVGMAGRAAGSLTGFMNTAGQLGSFLTSVLFGLFVTYFHSYQTPVLILCGACFVGALTWSGIDGTRTIAPNDACHGDLVLRDHRIGAGINCESLRKH